jgi:hypothetical protein
VGLCYTVIRRIHMSDISSLMASMEEIAKALQEYEATDGNAAEAGRLFSQKVNEALPDELKVFYEDDSEDEL